MLPSLTLLAVCLMVASPAVADEAETRARKLVEREIKAMGGGKALKKSAIIRIEEAGTYHGMGQ
jgi:hypothetical protein